MIRYLFDRPALLLLLLLLAIVLALIARSLERDERRRRRLARIRALKIQLAERKRPDVQFVTRGPVQVTARDGRIDVEREPVDAMMIRARQRIEAIR